jgi:hypothetical protein
MQSMLKNRHHLSLHTKIQIKYSYKLRLYSKILLSTLFLLFPIIEKTSIAQMLIPLNREIIQRIEPEILRSDPYFFTVLKPYNETVLRTKINIDSLLDFDGGKRRSSWFGRKLLEESFLRIDSPNFTLTADPLFDFSFGKEQGNSQKLITNTRGFRVRARIGSTIGIESSFYENQAFVPTVWSQYIKKTKVAPGQGRAKPFQETGWDYAYSTGSISWKPRGVFSLQFGHDKNFIGDGYRSLLLSDVSANYTFLRFSLTWKKFQYTRIIAALENIDYHTLGLDTKEFPFKTANFHLVSVNILKKLQLSLFEGTILKNPDDGKFKLTLDVASPVPFLDILHNRWKKPATDQINSIGGINLNWRISPTFQLYNQWCLDVPVNKAGGMTYHKYGYQLGLKYFHAFTLKNLILQAEYNKVQPYTYAQTDSTIAYSHFSQPLSHPLGANFNEIMGSVSYRFKRCYGEYMITSARYGADTKTNNSGKDILRPSPQVSGSFLQGIKTDLITQQARLSWYLNPATNSCISAGVYWQRQKSAVSQIQTKVIYLSFSTNLRNLYYDF